MEDNKINYEELELLVKTYQDGSQDAADELVSRFDGYFQKFINVCKQGRFNISDKTQRGFIGLFIQDEDVKKNLHKFKRSPYVQRKVYHTVARIRAKLYHLDNEELRHEMVIIFLTLAMRHNHSAPLNKYIKFIFPRRVFDFIVEESTTNQEMNAYEISYYEEMPEAAHYDYIDYDALESKQYLIHSQTATDYDANWVNGYTCGDLFKSFTSYERRILKWYYEWRTLPKHGYDKEIHTMYKERFKRTEQDIADLLGCSRKTVNIKRNEIKSCLEELCLEINLLRQSVD